MRITAIGFTFFILVFSGYTFGEDQCGAISCDCAVLDNPNWKQTCQKRQRTLIENCRKTEKVSGYCSVHGPAATTLPLALQLGEVETLPTDALSPLYKKVAALYWSTHTDLSQLEEMAENAKALELEGKVKVVKANITTLFGIQKQITNSWQKAQHEEEARASWRDFSSDQYSMAQELEKVGRLFWRLSNERSAEERKKFEALAFELLNASGEVLEQSAYAYAQSGQHDKAANNWQEASDSLDFLIGILSARSPNSIEVENLKFLQAARMYRASYHWAIEKRDAEAENSLKKAGEIFNGKVEAAAS